MGFYTVLLGASITGYLLSKLTTTNIEASLAYTYMITISIYAFYLSYIFPFYISELRHIPTVPGLFPLHQFYQIITTEVGVCQRKWHAELNSPIVRYFFPFTERLSIVDDEAIKQITVRNPYNYPKPAAVKSWMVRILGEGVLLAEGEEHVHQRKSLAPGFSTQSIRALDPVFWMKGILLSNLWREDMETDNVKSKTIEVLDWLNRCTLDIIGSAGFGTELGSLENPDRPIREAYRLCFGFDVFSRILHGLHVYIPAIKYVPAKMNRDIETARKSILKISTHIIEEKQMQATSKSNHKDIIALLTKEDLRLKNLGETGLSFDTLRSQVMTMLGAGHDTTATGVAWTLHLLSIHPEIQERLRCEIKKNMPFLFDVSKRNDPESLVNIDPDKLSFLDNVCRESLRYIPPIPMTVRKSINDEQLAGYKIPGGTVIYIIANTINRWKPYWGPTADEFDPDRWDKLPATYTSNAMMTFLQGPRGCIGRKFAETEMKILLCCLLSMYKFERDMSVQNPEELKMWRLVLRPRDGMSLRVTLLD